MYLPAVQSGGQETALRNGMTQVQMPFSSLSDSELKYKKKNKTISELNQGTGLGVLCCSVFL